MNNDQQTIRFARRMRQLPPYLFGMINKSKMKKRRRGDDVIDLVMGNPIDPAPTTVSQKLSAVASDPKAEYRLLVGRGLPSFRRGATARLRTSEHPGAQHGQRLPGSIFRFHRRCNKNRRGRGGRPRALGLRAFRLRSAVFGRR